MFKPLSFGIICYTATDNSYKRQHFSFQTFGDSNYLVRSTFSQPHYLSLLSCWDSNCSGVRPLGTGTRVSDTLSLPSTLFLPAQGDRSRPSILQLRVSLPHLVPAAPTFSVSPPPPQVFPPPCCLARFSSGLHSFFPCSPRFVLCVVFG